MNRQDIDFMDVVFPTFPSDTDIRGNVDDLKSGKYWIIITKLDIQSITTLSTIQSKYYTPGNGDFGHNIFPFEEGVKFADFQMNIQWYLRVQANQE